MDDWRARAKGGTMRLRSYYETHPSIDSRITLNAGKKNRYGDPMPTIEHRFDDATAAREERVQQHIRAAFDRIVKAANGKIFTTSVGKYLDHPGGGCRQPARSTDCGRGHVRQRAGWCRLHGPVQ